MYYLQVTIMGKTSHDCLQEDCPILTISFQILSGKSENNIGTLTDIIKHEYLICYSVYPV